MNKVVLLREIKNESKCIEKSINDNTESLIKQYSDFETKIFNNKLNSKNNENDMSKILEKNFYYNKSLFINFINSIYNDYLGTNSIIEFYKNKNEEKALLVSPNCVFNVKVEDEYRTLDYRIEIQSNDYENIAILIDKNKDTYSNNNIVNFKKKKDEYKSLIENKEKEKSTNICLIMLNSNINIPEKFDLKESNSYIKIIKLWKYDFKNILEKNMELLLPAKTLDLKNAINSIKSMNNSEKIIDGEIKRFYNAMNRCILKLKEKNIITVCEDNLLYSISKEILSLIY